MPLITMRYVHKAPFQLEALALTIPVSGEEHPNKAPFTGVLTRIDEPSTRPPNGSNGHRVRIASAVAEAALPSLVGMPIDCSLRLDDHNKKRVIGVIEHGYIEGKDLIVEGYLLEKNFPDEVAEIRLKKDQLGMSYEISDVEVADTNADIWDLEHFIFTGAAILAKDAAAYAKTSIAAAQGESEALEVLLTTPEVGQEFLACLRVLRSRVAAAHQRRAAYGYRG